MAFYFWRMQGKILIVGAGLAGLCLGLQLYRRGVPFCIRHSPSLPCSSEKAAGLMNPVVVKRLLKTWLADDILPYNRQFYPEAEQLTGARFYAPVAVHRLFTNAEVAGEWQQRVADGDMADFLSPEKYIYATESLNNSGFGGADILQAAQVECGVFISALRQFFTEKGLLETGTLDYTQISPRPEGITFNGDLFSQVVFCEGMQVLNNPWFGQLPMVPTKGELLYLDIPDFSTQKEVLRGVFLAPLLRGGFVCGSTYEWQFADEGPTEAGKAKLLHELSELVRVPYEIKAHTAGIRPASRDRRPFLGEHPTQKGLFVFNGLGTKGYMLAPYLSHCLAEHILSGAPLQKEMDIKRLKSVF